MNEIQIVDSFSAYLKERGVNFYANGFPVFQKEWFADTEPKAIVPFSKRYYLSEDKKDISVCFYECDTNLYPRFKKIFKEIGMLKKYHSVCMMDISVSPLMLDEVQRMNLLLNLLYTCVLAVNNIKIIPSYRTGNFETLLLLMKSVGYSKIWVMGTIGTQLIRSNAFYEYLFRTKCLLIMPKKLLSYGSPNSNTTQCLNDYGIEYRIYKDFRSLSYSKEVHYG